MLEDISNIAQQSWEFNENIRKYTESFMLPKTAMDGVMAQIEQMNSVYKQFGASMIGPLKQIAEINDSLAKFRDPLTKATTSIAKAMAPLYEKFATLENLQIAESVLANVKRFEDAVKIPAGGWHIPDFEMPVVRLPSARDQMRDVVREELERAFPPHDADAGGEPDYGSDGVKRYPGFIEPNEE